jgi:hypothetical protein
MARGTQGTELVFHLTAGTDTGSTRWAGSTLPHEVPSPLREAAFLQQVALFPHGACVPLPRCAPQPEAYKAGEPPQQNGWPC